MSPDVTSMLWGPRLNEACVKSNEIGMGPSEVDEELFCEFMCLRIWLRIERTGRTKSVRVVKSYRM